MTPLAAAGGVRRWQSEQTTAHQPEFNPEGASPSDGNQRAKKRGPTFSRQYKMGLLAGTCLMLPVSAYIVDKMVDVRIEVEEVEVTDEEFKEAIDKKNSSLGLGGPFEMTQCENGRPINNEELFNGQWTFLYFGFSKCAEICPNTLKFITDVVEKVEEKYKKSNPQEVEKLQVAFVSVDHIRDDQETLKKFLSKFHKTRGLCGTLEQIQTATGAWRVYYSSMEETQEETANREEKAPGMAAPNPKDDTYQLDHSAAIYFVGPDGKLKDFFFREMGHDATMERVSMHFDDTYGLGK